MPTGPKKLILINAGRYDFAEVELSGAVQLVGPNNAGKTTLINTLQYLYIDDRGEMRFGEYTPDQTIEYYFRSQYSYILFECLGARGRFVLGWRGHSKIAGKDPQRFHYEGGFARSDFFDESGRVLESDEVSGRLSLKQFKVLKSAQKHREFLLPPTKADPLSSGIVALRQPDNFHYFRETFKNLLTLSSVTQQQMRERLLMLADISGSRVALDIRKIFGQSYEDIIRRRDDLRAFKRNLDNIHELMKRADCRAQLRADLMHRWKDLRPKKIVFESEHAARIQELRDRAGDKTQRADLLKAKIEERRDSELGALQREAGGLDGRLKRMEKLAPKFEGFGDTFPELRLKNLNGAIRELDGRLRDAERETLDSVEGKLKLLRKQASSLERTAAHFERALVTVLRKEFDDAELTPLAQLFSSDLLELPVGDDGIRVKDHRRLFLDLRAIQQRIKDGVYSDPNVDVPLTGDADRLASLRDPAAVRGRLEHVKSSMAQWEAILDTIAQRDGLIAELKAKGGEADALGRDIHGWELYRDEKKLEPELKSALALAEKEIRRVSAELSQEEREVERLRKAASQIAETERAEEEAYKRVLDRFSNCHPPVFSGAQHGLSEPVPERFDLAVELFLRQQQQAAALDQEISDSLMALEKAVGSEYTGGSQEESIALLREGIEALDDREKAIKGDWEHQFQEVRALFSQVLTALDDIKSAAENLRRALSTEQVSDIRSMRMDVEEQSDIVEPIRRMAHFEQPGLFDDGAAAEKSLDTLRKRFENSPLLHYTDLFTLVFTVEGDDGETHRYHDFTQVESDGTTITVKVLFNLVVLRSLLREDSGKTPACEIPFFLDEIHSLDPVNRHSIVDMARRLGFIAITAAPASISEVDWVYYVKARSGRVTLQRGHRIGVSNRENRA